MTADRPGATRPIGAKAKGIKVTSADAAAPAQGGAAGKPGPLPFNMNVAHQARMYDWAIQQAPADRSRQEVARFFTGTDLVEPGLVRVEEWRPDPTTDRSAKSSLWGGVGRKR